LVQGEREWWQSWRSATRESASIAFSSVLEYPLRSTLAISGVVIGVVTVVLVASVLANVRNQVALLFRELGTENVFAFHLSGDPYQEASEREARRRPLLPSYARPLEREGPSIRKVAVQAIVPTVVNGRPLVARAGGSDSDTVLVEGASSPYFEVVGADFARGRPFTELEDRAGASVAVVGANLARALFGPEPAPGKSLTLLGERYYVVGELALRRGGFFGENRQDNVLALPLGTVSRRFPEVDRMVLYIQAEPGRREGALREAETILRRLRKIPLAEPNDFNLSTSEQIIRSFDRLSGRIVLATVGLAAVSLLIGGIGIANVMVMGVTERTREIGTRLALGARRRDVKRQFLLEAALLSAVGGALGVLLASMLGLLVSLFASGFSARPPLWATVAGLAASVGVGVAAGYWPARRAASLDPVEALRYE
jgi:putative ABC transport system permease protein